MFSKKFLRGKFKAIPQLSETILTFIKKYYIIYIENKKNKGETIYVR